MRLAQYLIDTSAIVRLFTKPDLRERWEFAIGAGSIAYCAATELELRFSARSVEHDETIRRTLNQMFVWAPMYDRCWERALIVQDALVTRGEQRSAGTVDLLVAANADQQGLTLLHDDKDFECIARITGQPLMRVDSAAG